MCDLIDIDVNNQARLELVLEVTGIGMWDFHLQTGMAFCSNQCKHILGFTLDNKAVSEKTFLDNVHPEDRERVLETAHGAILNQKDYNTEYRVIWQDGSIHWIAARGRTIYNSGQPVRMLGTVQDITARKVAEAEREELLRREVQARTEAETANIIKEQFLAVLSHEIRSPLNPILGWTKLLKSGKLDGATSSRALDTIERNVKLQTQLIDDLLDISKILRGKISLDLAAVNLLSTITSAIETVELAAQTKNIYIDYINNISTPNSCSVWGDINRLQQILGNLLSNAIKFTPTGGKVSIRLERVESQIQIAVSDTGKGIIPEFLPYVFDYFSQADNSTTRKSGGLGLGLAIVRQLVELHHGTVQAYSAGEGQGATFTVRLPAYQVEQIFSESNISTVSNFSTSLFGIKILVVDDEADTRELLQLILEQSGATVTVVSSATEVFNIINQVQPDILLSDIAMPQTDGYKLIRQIREMAPQSQYKCNLISAIALTAYASDSDEQKACEAGFQLHLAKPIDPDELVNAIAKVNLQRIQRM